MIQNIGFVKLYRHLHGSFSGNPIVDRHCWEVFVHLLENSFWQDGVIYDAGQVKTTATEISKAIDRSEKIVRTSISLLCQKGAISIERASNYRNSGYIFTILEGSHREVTGKSQGSHREVITDEIQTDNNLFEKSQGSHREVTGKSQGSTIREEERRKKKEGRSTEEEYITDGANASSGVLVLDPPMKVKEKKQSKSGRVMEAYKMAYYGRYGVNPLSNAKINAQACKLIEAVGEETAIELVKFYLSHNDAWYLKNAHSLGICLSHADKLFTEYQKNDYIRATDVKRAELSANNAAVFDRVFSKYEKEKQ